jgi:hypothetical protein
MAEVMSAACRRREPLLVKAAGAVKATEISARKTISAARRARLPGRRVCKIVLTVAVRRAGIELRGAYFLTTIFLFRVCK